MSDTRAYERVGYFRYGKLTEYGKQLLAQLKKEIDEAEESGEVEDWTKFILEMQKKYSELTPCDVANMVLFNE